MEQVRIFISSPGDVSSERQRAREIIDNLQRRYTRRFLLKAVFWEDLPLPPDLSFQEGIDVVLSTKGVDIAVFILWSRLGSPTGKKLLKSDGSEYRSGTEREYDLMLQARAYTRQQGKEPRPSMLVYTRQDDVSFNEALRFAGSLESQKMMLHQKEELEAFKLELFRDQETGANIGAFTPFDRPTTFSQKLRTHLQSILDEMAGDLDEVIWDSLKQGSPFPGLEAFQDTHASVFFGREEEIVEARHALWEQARKGCAFLLLSGASGSGKSSLARAGLLPEILANEVDDLVAAWRSVVLTPSMILPDPVTGLVRLMAEDEVLPSLRGESLSPDELAAALKENPELTYKLRVSDAFASESRKAHGNVRLLLVIDQLEELFTSAALSPQDRTAFAAVLETFARSGSIWIVATIRSDFYHHIESEPALVRMKGAGGLFDVLPVGPDALGRLVQEPVRMAGLSFEVRNGKSLADRIVNEAIPHAELLPLVSFMLRELYEQRSSTQQLTYEAYDTLGGVEGALAKRAEQSYATLSPAAQQALDPVLRALVTLGSASASASEEKVIRHHAALASFTPGSAERTLVDAFINARLFTTGLGGAANEANVTVSHESLLRVWPRAAKWAERNREFLRVRARVENRRAEGSPLLAGDPLLATAAAYLKSEPQSFSPAQQTWIREQIAVAEAAARRTAKRRRLVFAGLGLLALIAGAGGLLAWQSQQRAELNRLLAEERQKETERERVRNGAYHLLHRAANLRAGGRLAEALGLLDEAHSTFPDFSTRSALLDGLVATPPELDTTFHGFGEGIDRLCFSGDGSLIATSPRGAWWKLDVGKAPQAKGSGPAGAESNRVQALKRSGNGVSGWTESGREITSFPDGHEQEPPTSAADTQSRLLTSFAGKSLAHVLEEQPRAVVMNGKTVPMEERVSCLAMSESGLLAVGLENGAVLLLKDENQPLSLRPANGSGIASMAWSTTAPPRLVVGDEQGGLAILVPEAEPIPLPRIPSRPVAMEWHPSDGRIAVGGGDGLLRILTPDEGGYQIESLAFHPGPVLAVAWSEEGTRLASGGQDGSIAIWRTKEEPGPVRRRKLLDSIPALDVTTDGEWIAAGTTSGEVLLWKPADGTKSRQTRIEGGGVYSLAWKPDGSQVAAGSGDDRVFLLDREKDDPVASFKGVAEAGEDELPVVRVRWSPKQDSIAVASYTGDLRISDPADGTSRTLGKLPDLALGLAWSPDGNKLAAASTHGEIMVWSKSSGAWLDPALRIDPTEGEKRVSVGGLAWSPSGETLAACDNDGYLRLWNPAATSAPLKVSTRVDSQLEEVVYSEDGKMLATAGSDGFLRLWQAENLEPYAALRAHAGHTGIVVWRGDRLISASEDASIFMISLHEEEWSSRARRVAGTHVSIPPPP